MDKRHWPATVALFDNFLTVFFFNERYMYNSMLDKWSNEFVKIKTQESAVTGLLEDMRTHECALWTMRRVHSSSFTNTASRTETCFKIVSSVSTEEKCSSGPDPNASFVELMRRAIFTVTARRDIKRQIHFPKYCEFSFSVALRKMYGSSFSSFGERRGLQLDT